MIFYRCNIFHTDMGCMVSWHPSFAAARRHWLENTEEFEWSDHTPTPISPTLRGYDWGDGRIEQYEIEPIKERWLRWLNAYFDTDNG